mmetsp:Transcript_11404/g.42269  ORF Transcript_11404/g.42269 Transcript_11404/m.42269 type:complete len:363 (+) Transcript_11404:1-1089(+)
MCVDMYYKPRGVVHVAKALGLLPLHFRHFALPSDFIKASRCAFSSSFPSACARKNKIRSMASTGSWCSPGRSGASRDISFGFRSNTIFASGQRGAVSFKVDIAATPPVNVPPRPPPVRLMRFPRPRPEVFSFVSPLPRPLIKCLYDVYVAPLLTFAMILALFRDLGAAPLGGGGDSGGESLSGFGRFPRPSTSRFCLFSSFCVSASSQHSLSSMGFMSRVIFSNSLKARTNTPSQIGGIFEGSTAPSSGSRGPSFFFEPFSSESVSESLPLVLYSSLDPSPPFPSPNPPNTRTRFLLKSGGCVRERFSQSKSMRTATRKDVRPYRPCACGLQSNQMLGFGGLAFLGTKNSKPSLPFKRSGSS